MNSLLPYLPLLFKGAYITLASWVLASSLSLCAGILMGILSCRSLALQNISYAVRTYTFIAKGVPAYVQILIAYFVIPGLLNINMPGFVAATLALAFCSSGYITEIVRSGINTVPAGQWDACLVLGYPLGSTLMRIILPQALRNVLPALFGELEQLLKSTSLLATIGIIELTRAGMNIISRELNPLPVYLTIACIYLLFSALLQWVLIKVERKARYGYR